MTGSEKRATFFHAPLIARTCTIAAGPLTNLALAIVAFGAIAYIQGKPTLQGQAGSINPGTPAEQAGIKTGDVITAVNTAPTPTAEDVIAAVQAKRDTPMVMTIRRGSETLDLGVTAVLTTKRNADGAGNESYPVVGFSFATTPDNIFYVPMGIGDAVVDGLTMTYPVAEVIAISLKRLVTGEEGIENLSGPVRLAAILDILLTDRSLPAKVRLYLELQEIRRGFHDEARIRGLLALFGRLNEPIPRRRRQRSRTRKKSDPRR